MSVLSSLRVRFVARAIAMGFADTQGAKRLVRWTPLFWRTLGRRQEQRYAEGFAAGVEHGGERALATVREQMEAARRRAAIADGILNQHIERRTPGGIIITP